jgi:hypothetical protein
VTIPEEMIMAHLDTLLTSSEPGASMHHLHVVAAPTGAVGPLGVPDEKQLAVKVYAIAPDGDVEVERFIAKVIMAAAVEASEEGAVPLFAGMSQEVWTVHPMDELGRRLAGQGRLHEHPDAAELTIVYGASRDGRRWRGRRWLTGPRAGTTENVDLLVGRPHPHEGYGVVGAALVRRLVGIQ